MDFLQLLPQDLVFNHIFKRLDFTSRLRAAAVCRAWRRISLAAPPMADMPWLWFTWEDKPTSAKKQYLRNLSSFADRETTSHCPGLRATKEDACGCRGPYLTLQTSEPSTKKKPEYIIYNPFNADIFPLPCTIRDEDGSRRSMQWIVSAQLSSKPPNCLVVALDGDHNLYVCRPQVDHDWVKGPKTFEYVFDMIFFEGELYCIDGEIMAFDVTDNMKHSSYGREVLVHQVEEWCRTNKDEEQYVGEYYLVESGGVLLLVAQFDCREHCWDNKITFEVYRVDQEKGMLVRVDDLGDRMLFVQRGCSQSWSGPEPTSSGNFFSKNCIYFAAYMHREHKFRVGKFRLGSSCCEFQFMRLRPDIQIWVTPSYPD